MIISPKISQYLQLSEEVRLARLNNKPVVALESTIITHGMPYPQNLDTAIAVEEIIREHGAVPATIAVMDGKLRIGLDPAELEQLAQSPDAHKVSRRDLAYILASGKTGATTVAATMIAAALAHISVFVTGGIGGVHRGAETSFDISADLQELAQTSVAVVCAGAKSILDLGLTLEYLETHGVPVVSVGQAEFPAFFTRNSGYKADFQIDSPAELADFILTKWELGLQGGVLVTNPVPAEDAMPEAEIEGYIQQALQEAAAQGVSGKAITPFMLDKITRLSAGRSLATNIALVKNNARLGAQLALALHHKHEHSLAKTAN